jgi:hypothetical protein
VVAAAPTNHAFEDGGTGWAEIGDPTKITFFSAGGVNDSGYVNTQGSNNWAESSAFTVTSEGTLWTLWLKRSGGYGQMYVATSPYTSWSQKLSVTSGATDWTKFIVDLASYAGQTIKVRYRGYLGNVNFDDGAWRDEVPGWAPGGKVSWLSGFSMPASTASLGDYSNSVTVCRGAALPASSSPAVHLSGNQSITTDYEITIPSHGGLMSFLINGSGAGAAATIFVRRDGFSPSTLFNKSLSGGGTLFTTCDMSEWAGQQIKIQISSSSGRVADGWARWRGAGLLCLAEPGKGRRPGVGDNRHAYARAHRRGDTGQGIRPGVHAELHVLGYPGGGSRLRVEP